MSIIKDLILEEKAFIIDGLPLRMVLPLRTVEFQHIEHQVEATVDKPY